MADGTRARGFRSSLDAVVSDTRFVKRFAVPELCVCSLRKAVVARRSGGKDAQLETSVERHGDADEGGVVLPRLRVGRQIAGMREHVVGHDQGAGCELLAGERK